MPTEHDRAKLYELLIKELEDFAVFLIGMDGRISSWNPGVERFFGYPESEFVGRSFGDIFTPEDRERRAHEEELNTARRAGRSEDIRWHMCYDGSRVFVEGVLTSIRDESGEVCGFSKIARAVRPRSAAGSMLTAMFEGTDDPIYAIDKDGRFVFANTSAARLMDRSVEEVIGQRRDGMLPAAVAADLRATDESVLASAHPRLVEERFPTPDRGERIMLTTKAPWRDPEGKLIGLVATAKDVTARVAHQGERERLLREVRRANEELSTFSLVVAHDLRAPLRAVRAYTDLLARHLQGRLDPTSVQFMTFVAEGAASMERLIDSLLRYAESGDELSTTTVNVNAVVDGLLHNLEPLILETGSVITAQPLPAVQADPVRLLQLFQNLIVNAMNYRSAEPPHIQISGETSPSGHLFAISDNGVGIPREHLEAVFAPLKRLNSKSVPGSGIGLALCRKIVERHGGRIWVESEVGKGSTFYFTLPLEPNN